MQGIKKKFSYLIRIVFFLLIFGSCDNNNNEQFTILATTSMLGDAIKHIVKDKVKVVTLMGAGIDPHTYQVTQQDVEKLTKADVIVYNGLYLEGKMVDLLGKLGKKRATYAAGDAIHEDQLILEPVFPVGIDPHIWFDIDLWKQTIQYLSDKLQKHHPTLSSYYQYNTTAYCSQLDILHAKNKILITEVPPNQRVLITAHDAFSYFGRAYGFEVMGLQGISTVAECGLRDIKNFVDIIIKRNIKAIFLETSVPDKSMRAVLEGCKKKGHHVKIGGYLYSDALGEPDSSAGTYQGMLYTNVNTIVNALK